MSTLPKPNRETLLAAAEWCDDEALKLTEEMSNIDTPLRERFRFLNQKRMSLFESATLMREAAMELEE